MSIMVYKSVGCDKQILIITPKTFQNDKRNDTTRDSRPGYDAGVEKGISRQVGKNRERRLQCLKCSPATDSLTVY